MTMLQGYNRSLMACTKSQCKETGFTLIELLVVITIIMILAGLLLGGMYPTLRFNALKNETQRRVNNVVAGVEMHRSGGDDLLEELIEASANRNLQLRPLREVIGEVMRLHGSADDLFQPDIDVDFLPPRLRTRHWFSQREVSKGLGIPTSWRQAGRGADFHVAFHDRQLPINRFDPTEPQSPMDIWGPVIQSYGDGNLVRPLFVPEDPDDTYYNWANTGSNREKQSYQARDYTDSPLGESLDGTLEVLPEYDWRSNDDDYATCDYRNAWPVLRERREIDASDDVVYIQESWTWGPVWHDASSTAHGATPIIPFPWGEGIISRDPDRGNQVGQVQELHMRDMNPLATPALLPFSGVLSSVDQDVDQWRNDRNPRELWNDSWGNPLLLAVAIHHAPRYDFVDDGPFAETINDRGVDRVLVSRELHGGRDYLHSKSKDIYGAARSIYLSGGAIGPGEALESPAQWENEGEDASHIKDLWTYITDRCLPADKDDEGWNWDETSFSAPPRPPQDEPWQGIRVYPDYAASSDATSYSEDRRDPSFLSAPQIIR